MDSLEQIAPRLLKNIDIYTKIGIHALNAEAPEPMFKLGEVKTAPKYGQPRTKWDREDDIQGPAFAAWQKKLIDADEQLKKTQKDGEYVGSLSGEEKRSRLPDDLQFFIDDEDKIHSRPFTAVAQWDVKFHAFRLEDGILCCFPDIRASPPQGCSICLADCPQKPPRIELEAHFCRHFGVNP